MFEEIQNLRFEVYDMDEPFSSTDATGVDLSKQVCWSTCRASFGQSFRLIHRSFVSLLVGRTIIAVADLRAGPFGKYDNRPISEREDFWPVESAVYIS